MALSEEKRWDIVRWTQEGKKRKEVAKLAKCTIRTVQNVLRYYRDYGDVFNPHALPRGGTRILDTIHLNFIRAMHAQKPTRYLDEYQDALWEVHGIDPSVATLCREMARMKYSHKQVSRQALEQNQRLRDVWVAKFGDIPPEWCFWLDEASVDDRTNTRDMGYAQLGRALVQREYFLRGQRYSMLPTLSATGIVALDIFEGSVTRERFVQYLETQVAPLLGKYPGPNSVVIIDNATVHHGDDIYRIIVQECEAKLIYLPPYSPDFNPIEQCFSAMKAWLRRHEREAVNPAVRPWLMHQAASHVTAEMAEGWIRNCGYAFEDD